MSSNYHTHCRFCDGIGEPEEYIEQAMKKNVSALGFSCHGPAPFQTGWTMSDEAADKYLAAIDRLKDRYQNRIELYKGMEIDYFAGDTRNIFRKYTLDYIIGAIHYVSGDTGGKYYSIDGDRDAFEETLNIGSGSSMKKLAFRYYETLLDMLQHNRIDILAHFDLLKKNNAGQQYFSEKEPWYIHLVKDVLQKVSRYPVLIEVNTGGIARGFMENIYPSEWIIRECKKLDIPIILNSDAHLPENIDFYFDEAKEIIKASGYTELWELHNGRWGSVKI